MTEMFPCCTLLFSPRCCVVGFVFFFSFCYYKQPYREHLHAENILFLSDYLPRNGISGNRNTGQRGGTF